MITPMTAWRPITSNTTHRLSYNHHRIMSEVSSESYFHLGHCRDLALLERRYENSKLAINRLPPEILSHILFIGTDFDRGVWRWESREVGSQHIASHVCTHWRNIAIGTPGLWKFIHVLGLPNEYTALCIARSGNTLLDVLVDMFSLVPCPNYPYNPALSTKPASEVLQFLTAHGAGAYRWRSLFVRFPESDLLPVFARFLNNNSPASLQLLQFECADWSFNPEDNMDELIVANSPIDFGGAPNVSRTLLGSSFSRLLELELVSSSGNYTYTQLHFRSLPTLRKLSISPFSPYSIDLTEILLFNPQLESLSLESGYYYGDGARLNRPDRYEIRAVAMPALRSLYVGAVDNALWITHTLSIIKAPILSRLAIRSFNQCTFGGEQRGRLVSHLTSGGDAPGFLTSSDSAYAPAYPSLQSLDTFHFPCKKKEFMRLMSSTPQLVHLIARKKQAEWLGEAPWMLPKLGSLEVPQLSIDRAIKLLHLRAEAGAPIQLIRLQGGSFLSTTSYTETLYPTRTYRPNVMSKYEYRRHGEGTKTIGDLRSIQHLPKEFSKECEDRLEYDLENDCHDDFFESD
ncbi:hypothetical protein RSOLAG1IB_07801 [Rhizoctonia solani AG-1 IB]|uniref:Uncharacterized protein n=1 Tax=Thanatephorus cucumeris (strain AG1-IB / isolate 7/3/14) TaxID=1108050 RepID=A0A0B7FFL6_THACB|nr:hypothetical protein RSOLAG1IB_07801 [Rhizoctonia solani AG-1 IB]